MLPYLLLACSMLPIGVLPSPGGSMSADLTGKPLTWGPSCYDYQRPQDIIEWTPTVSGMATVSDGKVISVWTQSCSSEIACASSGTLTWAVTAGTTYALTVTGEPGPYTLMVTAPGGAGCASGSMYVCLRWTAPLAGVPVHHYRIWRNGALRDTQPGWTDPDTGISDPPPVDWCDTDAPPCNVRYEYKVQSVSADGQVSTYSNSVFNEAGATRACFAERTPGGERYEAECNPGEGLRYGGVK